METSVGVGLGEIAVSQNRDEILVAFGLGSCVGIGAYDPVKGIAGLLHAVLPEPLNGSDLTSTKYVGNGINKLFDEMLKKGAVRDRLIIRMAGGANMLTSPGLSKTFDIGTRNIAVAQSVLETQKMKIVSQNVGGNIGRTFRVYVADGKMTIRMIGEKETVF
ncbi:MAG: chemotaxis protein CheD [Chloroflexi bacterium HGW-Chloroflexi-4]|jgi:chemotaxis protein CheD|nr:MAG: chemotaxis protein CheD [Chloroflexi bacterium HGW-Chloroflexi-4]